MRGEYWREGAQYADCDVMVAATQLSGSRNVTYLPSSGSNMLMQVPIDR